jgi:hypothetical protein
MYVFHLFLLKEKGGAKKFKASPNRSIIVLVIHLLCTKQYDSFLFATCSKGHAFPSGITNCRRCIPLCFS